MDNERIQLSNKATVDDKDVDEIEIIVTLQPGKTSTGLSPFVVERAILKYMADSFPSWAEYWMKPGSTLR